MIKGIDISHNNSPSINVASLPGQGLGFVWIKATQGLTLLDSMFQKYWQAAKPLRGPNFSVGAYLFFDGRFDGVAQARFYLSQGFDFSLPGVLPPTIDVEDLVVFQDGKINKALTDQANQWVAANWQMVVQRLTDCINYIQAQTGKKCVIYTYNNFPKEYFHGHGFPDNYLWLSSLQASCPVRYDTGKQPEFWQNTYRYQNTDLDGDFFTGTQEQLNQLANILS